MGQVFPLAIGTCAEIMVLRAVEMNAVERVPGKDLPDDPESHLFVTVSPERTGAVSHPVRDRLSFRCPYEPVRVVFIKFLPGLAQVQPSDYLDPVLMRFLHDLSHKIAALDRRANKLFLYFRRIICVYSSHGKNDGFRIHLPAKADRLFNIQVIHFPITEVQVDDTQGMA